MYLREREYPNMLHLAMQLYGYEIALLSVAFVLNLAVAYRIWNAGLAKEYPALFRYCTANAAAMVGGTILVRYASTQAYCYYYWFSNIVVDALALAVTLEIFRDIFKPYEALRHFGTLMFRWIVAVMMLVSIVSALSTGSLSAAEIMNSTTAMFDRGLAILQCGIVLFLLLSNRFIGISYRARVFGVSVGFGISAATTLLVLSVTHWAPASMIRPLGGVMSFAVCVGEGIWLAYFYLPQPERRLSDDLPESRRWEYALASMQSPAPEGMFLSSIDRTVERLLTKNNVATQQKSKDEKHWFGD
jgi:hypothetical protein